MTTWQTYWLFQLDSIQVVLCILTLLFGFAVTLLLALATGFKFEQDDDSSIFCLKYLKVFVPIFIPICLLTTFTPSTKTMAAIYVLPRIVSNDNLEKASGELGEIYGLAKEALKQAIGEGE